LLVACAQRYLARLLVSLRRGAVAADLAREARATFDRLGASREVKQLDALSRQL
jgi:hypothetical protein